VRHGSLFSGIGGFDLAATWAGFDNIFNCEKDPFCRKVLNYYWPRSVSYEDIYQFDATQYRGCVDIISGGFPCQPFSTAGKRKGKTDDRYLWPEARRVIMQARPQWVVLENVAGLFTILEQQSLSQVEVKAVELFCQDGKQKANSTIIRLQRRVIGSIISEIGSAGYILPTLEDGTPVVLCIPACAVGAPHRRDRIFFVAYADSVAARATGNSSTDGLARQAALQKEEQIRAGKAIFDNGRYNISYDFEQYPNHPNPDNERLQRGAAAGNFETHRQERNQQPAGFYSIGNWANWPSQSPFRSGNDGLPNRLDGITIPKWQTESIKGYGNAIVPQIAFEIFKAINKIN